MLKIERFGLIFYNWNDIFCYYRNSKVAIKGLVSTGTKFPELVPVSVQMWMVPFPNVTPYKQALKGTMLVSQSVKQGEMPEK